MRILNLFFTNCSITFVHFYMWCMSYVSCLCEGNRTKGNFLIDQVAFAWDEYCSMKCCVILLSIHSIYLLTFCSVILSSIHRIFFFFFFYFLQHRCVSIFMDKKTNAPTGFALGSIEGRVAIQYVNTSNPKDNFTFKCHRSNTQSNNVQDIYAVSCNIF